MQTARILSIAAAALALAVLSTSVARADSSDATCEVRKDGDTRKGASGPCTFSQRQGYVNLDLRNGDTYNLSPGNKPGQYKDQKGIKVVRTQAGGNTQEYKWEGGKKIIVTFNQTPNYSRPASNNVRAGAPASDLADLVGAKAGQAEGEFQRRGYAYTGGSTSGPSKYSNYYNSSKGRCVSVRTEEGRYQSIVQAPAIDCGH
jgi:hypothetical protein